MKKTEQYAIGQATNGESLYGYKGKLVPLHDLPKVEKLNKIGWFSFGFIVGMTFMFLLLLITNLF